MLKDFLPYSPFPWQQRLYECFVTNTHELPTALDLPTGTGKTSVLAIWLAALVTQAQSGHVSLPRRLVYIVNRRTIVDQATQEAEQLLARVKQLPVVKKVLNSLAAVSDKDLPIAISTLRGNFADNGDWKSDPARPAIVLGTVDMVLSKLLFRGYGDGKRNRVIHAGLLGYDTLLIHDESHLVPAACATLHQLVKHNPTLRILDLSATQRVVNSVSFQLDAADRQHPVLKQRIYATKTLRLHEVDDKKRLDELVKCALAYQSTSKTVAVFLKDLRSIEYIQTALGKVIPVHSICVLTGRLRAYERDQLVNQPIWQRFLPSAKKDKSYTETVYLITTSAGEVGVDLDAQYAVMDLTTLDSMIQRFGRVNRRGLSTQANIDVVFSAKQLGEKITGEWLSATLLYLQQLQGDASPANLAIAPLPEAALPVKPVCPTLDKWVLDELSATALPCCYPVRDFIHGLDEKSGNDLCVVWRNDLNHMQQWEKSNWVEEYLEILPIHASERLIFDKDAKFGARDFLSTLLEQAPQPNAVYAIGVRIMDEVSEWCLLLECLEHLHYYHTLILPANLGGVDHWGMPDAKGNNPPAESMDVLVYRPNLQRHWSTTVVDNVVDHHANYLRGEISPPLSEAQTSDPSVLTVFWLQDEQQVNHSYRAACDMSLEHHLNRAEFYARAIANAFPELTSDVRDALIIAARWHDKGKARLCWQQAIGNNTTLHPLAKSKSGRYDQTRARGYRHEFGSLLDALQDSEIQQHQQRELILHLIVSHHGWGRPHMPDRGWDREKSYRVNQKAALDVLNRFDRCQQTFGWWKLAWLEALLGAADICASKGEDAT